MFIENVRIALKSIRTNLLRTILTIFIIAFGIMALVGILTAIDSIKSSLTESFSMMGANTFTIESRSMRVHIGTQSYRKKNHEFISHKQADLAVTVQPTIPVASSTMIATEKASPWLRSVLDGASESVAEWPVETKRNIQKVAIASIVALDFVIMSFSPFAFGIVFDSISDEIRYPRNSGGYGKSTEDPFVFLSSSSRCALAASAKG